MVNTKISPELLCGAIMRRELKTLVLSLKSGRTPRQFFFIQAFSFFSPSAGRRIWIAVPFQWNISGKELYFYYHRSQLLYRPYFLPLSCHYPFTAPIIITPTTYFCILKYTIKIGNVAQIKKANARFKSEVYSLK